jgi:uncharacterized cupin superfamily protein
MAKRIDPKTLPILSGSTYPAPYDEPCRDRHRIRLGDVAGLTQYGVNLLRLGPDAWSSQRHWHTGGDEFIYVLSGEVTLISDAGEETLRAGDCAGFKAGDPDGHHLVNRSGADATVLEVGSRIASEAAYYPEADLVALVPGAGPGGFTRRDGTPYERTNRR